jgi:hypothetical protein
MIILITGCGSAEKPGPKGTAHGKVTYKGKPLPAGYYVKLYPRTDSGELVVETVQADGTFSLNGKKIPTGNYGLAAAPPEYRKLTDEELYEKKMKQEVPPVIIPSKYQAGDMSTIIIEIKENADTEVNVDIPEK